MQQIKNVLTLFITFLLCLYGFFFPVRGFSQEKIAERIRKDLLVAREDSIKMRLLLEISDACAEMGQFDSGFVFLRQGVTISQKHFSDKSIFQPPFKELYTNTLEYMAAFHGNQGRADSADRYLLILKKFMEETKDVHGLAYVLTMLGVNYYNLGDLASSSNAYYEALKLREKTRDKKGLSESYANLTFISIASGNFDQALVYANKSIALAKELKDTSRILFALGNLSATYGHQQNVEKARGCVTEALNIALKKGDSSEIAKSWSALADYTSLYGKKDSAITLFKNALRIYTARQDVMYIIDVCTRLGNLYIGMKDDKKAFLYLKNAYENAMVLNRPSQIVGPARLLSYLYKRTGKHKEALEMFELYVRMNDSLNNQEAKKASIKKHFQYEYEKRSAADSVRNAEEQKVKDAQLSAQTAQIKQEKFRRYSLAVGLLFVVCGLLFVVNRFRITSKQKKIIEQQKVQVDEAFARLHEKNKEVMDSIYYARRIQRALLTQEVYIERSLVKLRKKVP